MQHRAASDGLEIPLALQIYSGTSVPPPGPQVCKDPDGQAGSYKDGHLLWLALQASPACPDSTLKVPGQPSL